MQSKGEVDVSAEEFVSVDDDLFSSDVMRHQEVEQDELDLDTQMDDHPVDSEIVSSADQISSIQ